jgi:hypothetical protein
MKKKPKVLVRWTVVAIHKKSRFVSALLFRSRRDAEMEVRAYRGHGYQVGPIVRVEIPLPEGK